MLAIPDTVVALSPPAPGPTEGWNWTIEEAVPRSGVILIGRVTRDATAKTETTVEVMRVLKGKASGVAKIVAPGTKRQLLLPAWTYILFLAPAADGSFRLLMAREHVSDKGERWEHGREEINEIVRYLRTNDQEPKK